MKNSKKNKENKRLLEQEMKKNLLRRKTQQNYIKKNNKHFERKN